MVAPYVADLRRAVSMARLERYRPAGGGDRAMVVNYFWNVALSEALHPVLAALEVVLRNAIHDALTTREGTDLWFYRPGLLEPRQLRDFAQARLMLYDAHRNQPTAGLIVAELGFGFWTTLLSQPYHQRLWAPRRAALLRTVFPHMPPTPNWRQHVQRRYNSLRLLRNRVFHHEPIWNRSRLSDEHREIMEAIGWISPTVRDSVALVSRFADVYGHGRGRIDATLGQRFHIP